MHSIKNQLLAARVAYKKLEQELAKPEQDEKKLEEYRQCDLPVWPAGRDGCLITVCEQVIERFRKVGTVRQKEHLATRRV